MPRSPSVARRPGPWGVAGSVLLLVAILGLGWVLWQGFRPLVVVGTDLGPRGDAAVAAALQEYSRTTGVPVEFRHADRPRVPGTDVAVYGVSARFPADSEGFVPLDNDFRSAVIPSLGPVGGLRGVVLWTDPLELLLHPGARPPTLVAGGDDPLLVRFLGQLVARAHGLEGYLDLAKATRSGAPLETLGLGDALQSLVQSQAAGLYHPNWLDFHDADVATALGARPDSAAVVPFSTHRSLDRRALASTEVERLFPGTPAAPAPIAAAPVVLSLTPSAGDRGRALARWLVSPEGQTVLVRGHGLVPSSLAVPAQDRQERWHRDALAGADVVAGLDRDGFTTPEALQAFAAEVRLVLRNAAAQGR